LLAKNLYEVMPNAGIREHRSLLQNYQSVTLKTICHSVKSALVENLE